MLLFTYQGKDWHSFTPSVSPNRGVKGFSIQKNGVQRNVIEPVCPKRCKITVQTSSQTVYVRKPDLVACKTQERLGGRPICEIYLNTYFQRARLGGRLICEIGLYASIYGRMAKLVFSLSIISYSGVNGTQWLR